MGQIAALSSSILATGRRKRGLWREAGRQEAAIFRPLCGYTPLVSGQPYWIIPVFR